MVHVCNKQREIDQAGGEEADRFKNRMGLFLNSAEARMVRERMRKREEGRGERQEAGRDRKDRHTGKQAETIYINDPGVYIECVVLNQRNRFSHITSHLYIVLAYCLSSPPLLSFPPLLPPLLLLSL